MGCAWRTWQRIPVTPPPRPRRRADWTHFVERDGVVAARAVPPLAVGAKPLWLLSFVRGEADLPGTVAQTAVVGVRVPRRRRPHHAALKKKHNSREARKLWGDEQAT